MSWSLVETRTLAIKAARGAGFNWGLAEEAGFAVQWLQARGAPGVAALARFLEGREATAVSNGDCPIALGATLTDGGVEIEAAAGAIRQPLLLAPFLATTPGADARRLIWDGVEIIVTTADFASTAPRDALLTAAADWRAEAADAPLDPNPCCDRVPDAEAPHIHILEKFCARIYAPATEQSRLLGAGAGREDDD